MASKTLYMAIAIVVVLVAVVALLLMGGGQQPSTQTITAQTSQKVFKLGATLPLTGGFSSYAKLAQCAAQLAIDDLNAEYESKGIRFELYVEDTQLDPNIALQKLQSLYARGMRAVLAGLTSREASGMKPFADQNKIITIQRMVYLKSPILNDWLYRIVGTDTKSK